ADDDTVPLRVQNALASGHRKGSHRIQDQVVTLGSLSVIFFRVIDDMVRAEGFRDLHRKRTDSAGGTVDENLLSGLDLSLVSKSLKRGDARYGNGGGGLERHVGRFRCQSIFLRNGILGKTAVAKTEHLVSGLEKRHALANRFDPPSPVNANPRVLGPEKTDGHAGKDGRPSYEVPVERIRGSRLNPHEHLIVLDGRFLDLFEPKCLRRSVLFAEDCFHRCPQSCPGPTIATRRSASTLAKLSKPQARGPARRRW